MVNEYRKIPESVHVVQWTDARIKNGWLQYVALKDDFERVIRKLGPDIIHAGPIQRVAFLPALINFHPLVSMSWGTDMMTDASRDRFWDWVTRFTLQHSDILIADCQAVGKVAGSYSFPQDHVVIFPWGIDLSKFKPASSEKLRQRMNWQNDFILLCTRNWEGRYGVDLVVRSFCDCSSQMPEARLVLIGGGSLEKELRNMVLCANLEERVSFLGRIDYEQLPEYYQAANLYLSASHSDGSSVSLMEALACGLPSLLSDIPSSFEWIEPGVQGWLFKDNDLNDLSEKMIAAYKMRNNLKAFQINARKTAEIKADWSVNQKHLFHSYELAFQKTEP